MSLNGILRAMFFKAFRKRGERVKTVLPNGLHIEMYVDQDGDNHLLLWRKKGRPSLKEFEIVLACWPQVLPTPRPAPDEIGDAGLKAMWRCPAFAQSIEPEEIKA